MNMNRELVVNAFREIKKDLKLDYAITSGFCCASCMNSELGDKYGINSKGIWLKYFKSGANRSEWDNNGIYYIAHDLNEDQAIKVVELLSKDFKVEWNGDHSKSIAISKKGDQ